MRAPPDYPSHYNLTVPFARRLGLASGASCNRLVVLGEADKAGRGQVSAVTLNGQNVTSGDNQHWPSHVCNKKEVKEVRDQALYVSTGGGLG